MPARKPAAVLDLNGAFDKNPQRRRQDPEHTEPLGEPPEDLADDVKAVWGELAEEQYPGVFTRAHRKAVENLARAYARLRREWSLDLAKECRIMLATLGMDPVNCTKLGVKPKDKPKGGGFTRLK